MTINNDSTTDLGDALVTYYSKAMTVLYNKEQEFQIASNVFLSKPSVDNRNSLVETSNALLKSKEEYLRGSLALSIYTFLDTYGSKDANDEELWSSPDAAMLDSFATTLLSDGVVLRLRDLPNSSWESCGYHPYTSKEGRKAHDDLMAKIKELIMFSRGLHIALRSDPES